MYFSYVLSDAASDKPNSGLSAVMKNLTVLERKRNCPLRNISTESLHIFTYVLIQVIKKTTKTPFTVHYSITLLLEIQTPLLNISDISRRSLDFNFNK
jgi:hypothetical protein